MPPRPSIGPVEFALQFRGAPPADRAALADALLRVSRLVGDLPEIEELDVNPLVALAPGEGVVAVDARARVRG